MGQRRRAVFASLALVALLVTVVGTSGVSFVAADRGLQVAVAADDEAYLGIDVLPDSDAAADYEADDPKSLNRPVAYYDDTTVGIYANETTLRLLTVTNWFGHEVDVTVDLEHDRDIWWEDHSYLGHDDPPDPIESIDRQPGGLAPGQSGHLDVEVDCQDPAGGTIELHISAESNGVHVTAIRTVDIYCS